ncbi:hypothetical protein EDEG_01647 [Edhazardia aedis USNM 41457]|uniref:Uncharacterized protein n=1 Tax=Edhazardia aedis (strain USNM 41457) TaxID=1003232 RepID=J9D8K4_EDHAE|nr:hypothetical protein EDEG_01647 [Edhazardia aedis USNM 41457]|eukprot:EJW04071.1 hypothetical protein EDEG_01647 [Edhazardia aedis USNM 41457]
MCGEMKLQTNENKISTSKKYEKKMNTNGFSGRSQKNKKSKKSYEQKDEKPRKIKSYVDVNEASNFFKSKSFINFLRLNSIKNMMSTNLLNLANSKYITHSNLYRKRFHGDLKTEQNEKKYILNRLLDKNKLLKQNYFQKHNDVAFLKVRENDYEKKKKMLDDVFDNCKTKAQIEFLSFKDNNFSNSAAVEMKNKPKKNISTKNKSKNQNLTKKNSKIGKSSLVDKDFCQDDLSNLPINDENENKKSEKESSENLSKENLDRENNCDSTISHVDPKCEISDEDKLKKSKDNNKTNKNEINDQEKQLYELENKKDERKISKKQDSNNFRSKSKALNNKNSENDYNSITETNEKEKIDINRNFKTDVKTCENQKKVSSSEDFVKNLKHLLNSQKNSIDSKDDKNIPKDSEKEENNTDRSVKSDDSAFLIKKERYSDDKKQPKNNEMDEYNIKKTENENINVKNTFPQNQSDDKKLDKHNVNDEEKESIDTEKNSDIDNIKNVDDKTDTQKKEKNETIESNEEINDDKDEDNNKDEEKNHKNNETNLSRKKPKNSNDENDEIQIYDNKKILEKEKENYLNHIKDMIKMVDSTKKKYKTIHDNLKDEFYKGKALMKNFTTIFAEFHSMSSIIEDELFSIDISLRIINYEKSELVKSFYKRFLLLDDASSALKNISDDDIQTHNSKDKTQKDNEKGGLNAYSETNKKDDDKKETEEKDTNKKENENNVTYPIRNNDNKEDLNTENDKSSLDPKRKKVFLRDIVIHIPNADEKIDSNNIESDNTRKLNAEDQQSNNHKIDFAEENKSENENNLASHNDNAVFLMPNSLSQNRFYGLSSLLDKIRFNSFLLKRNTNKPVKVFQKSNLLGSFKNLFKIDRYHILSNLKRSTIFCTNNPICKNYILNNTPNNQSINENINLKPTNKDDDNFSDKKLEKNSDKIDKTKKLQIMS